MKKTVFVIAAAALVWGCQQKPAGPARLSGTILNADTLVVRFVEGRNADTITLSADGSFILDKEITKPVAGTLVVPRKNLSVYLVPGKELTFTVDYADWDNTLLFGGDLKAVGEYLLEKNQIQRAWSRNMMANYMKEPADYRTSRDSLTAAFNSLLATKESAEGFDKDFGRKEKLAIIYAQVMDMKNFAPAHQYYAQKDTVILPDDWTSLENGLDLTDPLLADIPAAMNYLSGYISENAQKEAGLTGELWGRPEFLAAKFDFIKKTFTNPDMVENLMYRDLGQQMDGNGIAGIDAQLEAYYAVARNVEQVAEIKEKAAEWEAIQPGKPAPDFKVVDMQGVEHTLADYKGKYVFIDFWATWCGPCKVEIPHLKQLHEDFKDRNLAIMSISVDRDKAAWEKMVTEEGFAWLQFHDGTMENDKYVVKYIPTFVLIDMDGNILDPRAPRPSEPKLREVLEGLEGI